MQVIPLVSWQKRSSTNVLSDAKRLNVQVNNLSARTVHGFIKRVHTFRVDAFRKEFPDLQPLMLARKVRLMGLREWYVLRFSDLAFY